MIRFIPCILRRRIHCVVGLAALFLAVQANAQTAIFDFENNTDQGFGAGFGNDASATFSIVNIGGSLRMAVPDTASFQQAGRETGNPLDSQYLAMQAASLDEANYRISYDWYLDTSAPGNYGNFL